MIVGTSVRGVKIRNIGTRIKPPLQFSGDMWERTEIAHVMGITSGGNDADFNSQ